MQLSFPSYILKVVFLMQLSFPGYSSYVPEFVFLVQLSFSRYVLEIVFSCAVKLSLKLFFLCS